MTGIKSLQPKILHISDTHWFHAKLPSENLVDGFNTVMHSKVVDLSEIDLLILTGDIFDTTVPFSSDNAMDFYSFACQFLRECKFNDVTVYILEGTPSHDRRQSRWFLAINEESGINADIRYFDGLGTYRCHRTGKLIGYIKDEYSIDPDITYNAFKAHLLENNFDKVDILLTHTMWDFQAPINHPELKTFNSTLFMTLVNDYIASGHIHIKRLFQDKILSVGSLTRMKHGESESKGAWYITYSSDGRVLFNFIENTTAIIFTDLKVLDYSTEEDFYQLENIVRELAYPVGSYISVVIEEDQSHLAPLSFFTRIRPEYHWSKKVIKDKEAVTKIIPTKETIKIDVIEITRNNISQLVESRLKLSINDEIALNKHLLQLNEVINE